MKTHFGVQYVPAPQHKILYLNYHQNMEEHNLNILFTALALLVFHEIHRNDKLFMFSINFCKQDS